MIRLDNPKIDEKVELAKELGLSKWLGQYEDDLSELNMKFKPITYQEIRKRLNIDKLIWGKKFNLEMVPQMLSTGFLFIVIFFIIGMAFGEIVPSFDNNLFLLLTPPSLISLGLIILLGFRKGIIELYRAPVGEWQYDMPYGAMLAIKEAKEQGFKTDNMVIFYPQVRTELVKSDPIIIGFKGYIHDEKFYELFYWDEGKIYE